MHEELAEHTVAAHEGFMLCKCTRMFSELRRCSPETFILGSKIKKILQTHAHAVLFYFGAGIFIFRQFSDPQ